MELKSYKDLIVWQRAMELAVYVYKYTATLPREELYGITLQLRRCAVSIPSNIAEGWARKNTGEYRNFLSIANGSAGELDTQLLLTEKLEYGKPELRDKCFRYLIEVQKMLPSMIRSLR